MWRSKAYCQFQVGRAGGFRLIRRVVCKTPQSDPVVAAIMPLTRLHALRAMIEVVLVEAVLNVIIRCGEVSGSLR